MPANLGAILTAMVTPFDAQGRVNEESAVRLMNFLIENGSDGLVVCGTTGEATTLTDEEHLRVIELAVREVGDRTQVIAGVGSNDTRHAVELTESAPQLGAHAMLSVTPYYNKPNERGIIRHFEEVSKATDKPIVLYNIPGRTGLDMPNELLAKLAQIDHIEAVKQSRETDVEIIDGLDLYGGNDDMLAQVLDLGGSGGICVASHIFGNEMRAMVDEPTRRSDIDSSLQDAYKALFITANPIPVKAALNMLGHEVGGLRLPLVEASDQEAGQLREMLEQHGLLESSVIS